VGRISGKREKRNPPPNKNRPDDVVDCDVAVLVFFDGDKRSVRSSRPNLEDSVCLSSRPRTIRRNDMRPDTSFVPWSEREDLSIKNQVQVRGRKWKQIAEEFRKYFSWSRERLTIKHRAGWVACVD
jgi:hypothetical protein